MLAWFSFHTDVQRFNSGQALPRSIAPGNSKGVQD
jgi:hypothetical protein